MLFLWVTGFNDRAICFFWKIPWEVQKLYLSLELCLTEDRSNGEISSTIRRGWVEHKVFERGNECDSFWILWDWAVYVGVSFTWWFFGGLWEVWNLIFLKAALLFERYNVYMKRAYKNTSHRGMNRMLGMVKFTDVRNEKSVNDKRRGFQTSSSRSKKKVRLRDMTFVCFQNEWRAHYWGYEKHRRFVWE